MCSSWAALSLGDFEEDDLPLPQGQGVRCRNCISSLNGDMPLKSSVSLSYSVSPVLRRQFKLDYQGYFIASANANIAETQLPGLSLAGLADAGKNFQQERAACNRGPDKHSRIRSGAH